MKKIQWIILIALVPLFSSCCSHREKARVQLTNEQKQWMPPYQQDSVVRFMDWRGKPIDFTVSSITKWWQEMDIDYGAMCSDYALFETERIILKSTSDDCELIVEISPWMSDFDENGRNVLTWNETCDIEIIYSCPGEYGKFWVHVDKDGSVLTSEVTFLHKSLNFNNHVYYDVVERRYILSDNGQETTIGGLLYNKDYGIIRLEVNNHLLVLQH